MHKATTLLFISLAAYAAEGVDAAKLKVREAQVAVLEANLEISAFNAQCTQPIRDSLLKGNTDAQAALKEALAGLEKAAGCKVDARTLECLPAPKPEAKKEEKKEQPK